jgi:hypothetical protein
MELRDPSCIFKGDPPLARRAFHCDFDRPKAFDWYYIFPSNQPIIIMSWAKVLEPCTIIANIDCSSRVQDEAIREGILGMYLRSRSRID